MMRLGLSQRSGLFFKKGKRQKAKGKKAKRQKRWHKHRFFSFLFFDSHFHFFQFSVDFFFDCSLFLPSCESHLKTLKEL